MSNRYQREIEEILDQVNEDASKGSQPKGRASQAQRTRSARRPRSGAGPRAMFTSGRLMLAGVILIVSSLLMIGVLPSLAGPAVWLGIALLITGYLVYFAKPRRTIERKWRGESIEDPPEPNGLERLWRWLTRG
jgi:hypothetical protein